MDQTELAWAAGFWDGEGSAWLTQPEGRGTAQPQARINQSSIAGIPEVLIRFQRAVDLGSVTGPQIADGREPLYRWVVSSRTDVAATFLALRPWLGPVKRAQFERVLGLKVKSGREHLAPVGNEDLAWAAGLFDGEGSTYLEKHKSHFGYFRLEAAITQADALGIPYVLARFARVAGIGRIYGPYPAPEGHDPVYRWKAHRHTQIVAMLDALRPWLGAVKRDQADRAVSVVAAQVPLLRGNPAWGNRKTHCVNGHEYATARIRPFRPRSEGAIERRASKQCLACVREYARLRRRYRERKSGGH